MAHMMLTEFVTAGLTNCLYEFASTNYITGSEAAHLCGVHVGCYGFKLHAAINHHGELLSIKVTPGNADDRNPVAFLCRRLFGRVYADKGYVAQWLVDLLRAPQMDLTTKVRKNRKPVQQTPFDQALFKRRSLIETVFDELKTFARSRIRATAPMPTSSSIC